ncbi:MAG: DUF4388 domain-containing protein [Polyangia bacterium]
MLDTRDLVRIHPDGQIEVGGDTARRLAANAGDYRMLPTSGSLVLLQRLPDEVAATRPQGRALLAGEISRLGGLADIIQFISGNGWSGHLDIMSGQIRKALYVRRGDIQSAASNVAEDRLGAILYRFGLVSETALETTIRRSAGSASRIGQLLVEDGLLTAHELYTSMRRQVEEIFYSVLGLREGDFFFYRAADEDGPASQLLLSTKALLFEGVRRIDELSYFREKLPSQSMVLVRREPAPTEKLKPIEDRVLQLVDGLRTIEHVARSSQLGEFETTRLLFQLMQSGWIQPRTAREMASIGAAGDDVPARILGAFNEVYAKIHAAVKADGKVDALELGLESFFASVAEFSPLFVAVQVSADGTLPTDQLLFNLAMSPVEDKLDYLHRGLNELLFFELFTAGEAVDRREEIELHQRLAQILSDAPTAGAPSLR